MAPRTPRRRAPRRTQAPQTRARAAAYTRETLAEACAYKDANPSATYRGVEGLFGIPWTTIRDHHRRLHTPAQEAHGAQQLLSPEEELAVVDWLEHLSEQGCPLTKGTVLDIVTILTGNPKPPNKKWIYRFLGRHPEIVLGKPSGLDPKRAQAFNRPVVDDFFKQLQGLIETYDIPWSHVYNMDEKGVQRGGGRKLQNIKYFVPRGRRPKYKLRSSNLELVTIVECVCADGANIQPGFIFSGKEYSRHWFRDVDPRITVSMSPNGWTDDILCAEWFKMSFIPQATARKVSNAPILLILDGHGSHITADMRKLALDNNIHIFCLPPHTTHRLQPLDVGVFGPLQTAWQNRCNEYYVRSGGNEMERRDFIREYMGVRDVKFTPDLVKKAWRKCGITTGTFSADFFSEEDFAPSYSTSTSAHVPPSFPTNNPLFPENMPSSAASMPMSPPAPQSSVSAPGPSARSSSLSPRHLCSESHGAEEESDDEDRDEDEDEEDDQEDDGVDKDDEEEEEDDEDEQEEDEHEHEHDGLNVPSEVRSSATHPVEGGSTAVNMSATHALMAQLPRPRSSATHSTRRPPAARPTGAEVRLQAELNAAQQRIRELEEESRSFQSHARFSEAHAKIAQYRIDQLQQQLNHKKTRRGGGRSKTLRTAAICITIGEGARICEEEEAARLAESQRKETAQTEKEAREKDNQTRREEIKRNPSFAFTGTLKSQKKAGLQDIAYVVGLSMDGSVAELLEAITRWFDAEPSRKVDPKYAALFSTSRKRALPPDLHCENSENIPPPSQRPRPSPPGPAPTTPQPISRPAHTFGYDYPLNVPHSYLWQQQVPGSSSMTPGPSTSASYTPYPQSLSTPIPTTAHGATYPFTFRMPSFTGDTPYNAMPSPSNPSHQPQYSFYPA